LIKASTLGWVFNNINHIAKVDDISRRAGLSGVVKFRRWYNLWAMRVMSLPYPQP